MSRLRISGLMLWILWTTSLFASLPSNREALQAAVSRAMAGERGTAVVVDLATSEIIASYQLDVAARRVALPGSSIKPFTLLALLQGSKIDSHTLLMCRRTVVIGRHNLRCSHPETKQPLDPAAALAYSCNSYFTTVALRLNPAEFRNSLLGDGFGSASGLARDEASGQVRLASNQEQLQLQAVGEWGIRVTPLELVRAYASLARLLGRDDAKLAPLFAGLEQSVSYGMGRAAQAANAIQVAGKTGTSRAEDGSWTHAWFAGYAPAAKPEIAVVVFLERGRGGAEAAAVAREIFSVWASGRSEGRGR